MNSYNILKSFLRKIWYIFKKFHVSDICGIS